MSNNSSPSKARVLTLFLAFTVLFVIVFSLGVLVGKEFGGEKLRVTKRFDEPGGPTAVTPPGDGINEVPQREDVPADIESEPDESDTKDQEADSSLSDASPGTKVEPVEVSPEPLPVRTKAPATPSPEERLAKITKEIERELKREPAREKTPPAAGAVLPPVSPHGLYTVQIGSFQDQGQANKLASSLKSRGYPVFIKSMTASDNKTWYRVRVGTFNDAETATAYGESLRTLEPEVKLIFITANN